MHYYLNRRLGSAEGYMRSFSFHVPRTLMQAIVSRAGRHARRSKEILLIVNGRGSSNATSTCHLNVRPTSSVTLCT